MASHDMTCMATGTAIYAGEPIMVIPLLVSMEAAGGGWWNTGGGIGVEHYASPVGLPVLAQADDESNARAVVDDWRYDITKRALADLGVVIHAPAPDARDAWRGPQLTDALWEAAPVPFHAGQRQLGFGVVHRAAYARLVDATHGSRDAFAPRGSPTLGQELTAWMAEWRNKAIAGIQRQQRDVELLQRLYPDDVDLAVRDPRTTVLDQTAIGLPWQNQFLLYCGFMLRVEALGMDHALFDLLADPTVARQQVLLEWLLFKAWMARTCTPWFPGVQGLQARFPKLHAARAVALRDVLRAQARTNANG